MKRNVYADHAATTALSDTALNAMLPYFQEKFGNPSSLYGFGQAAKADLDAARAEVAACLGAKPDEIFFTSGGTEADNWALRGVAEARGGKGRHIITSTIEHHAILHTLRYLEKYEGFQVTYLGVDSEGFVNPADVKAAIRPDTILISIMSANNEIGTIEPVTEIGAIAREAGLLRARDDVALTSAQLNELSDDEVKKIIPRIRVIARALPTDKSRMVRLCQELNLVVGMTGDGVNDSPALKRADVGFAMGSGTEAAKEAGKIVILDDNFRSIKDAIWYGRTIYHNILKFCKFQLVINVAAVVVSAIAPFFGVEEPLKVTHLLFVNLVMDGLGAIMLGNEPAQERYMSEPPRRRDESIVSKSMMAQIVTMGLWLTALSFVFLKVPFFDSFFASTEQKLSAYFVLFIWSALFNAFNVRSDSFDIFKDLKLNPGFMQVFVIIVLVQAFIVNAALVPVPVFAWISNMFSCVPFPPAGWGVAILLAFTMIPVDILRKVIVGRK